MVIQIVVELFMTQCSVIWSVNLFTDFWAACDFPSNSDNDGFNLFLWELAYQGCKATFPSVCNIGLTNPSWKTVDYSKKEIGFEILNVLVYWLRNCSVAKVTVDSKNLIILENGPFISGEILP